MIRDILKSKERLRDEGKLMDTIVRRIERNNIEQKIIEEAGELLKQGKLVAFPTETVYGLGADALNEKAAEKIKVLMGDEPELRRIFIEQNANLVKDLDI